MLIVRRGFTLIELLVVVAIIALLIAILLPSLGRAKANGVRVKCGAQLRQWGQVIAQYAQENQDLFGLTWTEANGTTKHPWATIAVGTPCLYDNEWGNIDQATGVSRNTYKLRVCPGDPAAGLYSAGGAGYNAQNQRVPVDYAMVRYAPQVSNKLMWKTSEINHPGTAIMMVDSPTIQFGVGNGTMSNYYACTTIGQVPPFATVGDLDSEPGETMQQMLNARHMGIGDVLFVDSHVEQHTYQDFVKNITNSGTVPPPPKDAGKLWTLQNLP